MTAERETGVERRRVVFHGRVQGVFFRATTVELSRGFEVTGYARNMRDGSVEVEVQGRPDQVEGLVAAVRRHFRNSISDVTSASIPPEPDESTFHVRY